MSTLPDVRKPAPLTTPVDFDKLRDGLRQTLIDADAPATRRSYDWLWRNFDAWCQLAGLRALPATPEVVVLFLEALKQEGYARSTILMHRTAISQAHKRAGHETPTKSELVRKTVQGITNVLPEAPHRKDALRVDALLQMLPEGDAPAAVRDRALLLVGLVGGFRRSEVVAINRGHVTFDRQGATIWVPRSKTDRAGKGAPVGLLYARRDRKTCAPTALRDWMDLIDAADTDMTRPYVFRPINKANRIRERRLTPESLNRIVQKHAARAGVDVDLDISAHSLRSGMATELASRGAKLEDIAKHGRWRSLAMVLRYYRPATVYENNPSGLL